jgi:hypothetical protein
MKSRYQADCPMLSWTRVPHQSCNLSTENALGLVTVNVARPPCEEVFNSIITGPAASQYAPLSDSPQAVGECDALRYPPCSTPLTSECSFSEASFVTAPLAGQYQQNLPACAVSQDPPRDQVRDTFPWANQQTCAVANGYAPPPAQWLGGRHPLSSYAPCGMPSTRSAIPQASCLPLPHTDSQVSYGLNTCSPTAFDPSQLAVSFPRSADQETFAADSIWDTQAHWQPPRPSLVMALESPFPISTFAFELGHRSMQVVDLPQPAPGGPFDTTTYQTTPISNHPPQTPLLDTADLPFTDAPLSRRGSRRGSVSDASSSQPRRLESRPTRHALSDPSVTYKSWPKGHRTKQRVACQGCRG